jgi:hypothetical protein
MTKKPASGTTPAIAPPIAPAPRSESDPLACVEHHGWTPIPRPQPAGPLLLRLKDVDPDESAAVKERRVMTFHMTGCTGHYQDHVPETRVAAAMSQQIDDPHCFGGEAKAVAPSFFFHLGDIVYKGEDDPEAKDQQKLFNEHFYTPYAGYARNIFALAGNHDGKDSKHPEKSAVQHFLKNFCDSKRSPSPDNPSDARLTMVQPYLYWLLRTPVAYIVALYSNVLNGGQLDDPAADKTPQYEWLVATLKSLRKEAAGRAVFLAVHYPPYSAAANFPERGDPNLSPSPPRTLQPLGMILQDAFRASGLYPDAVFSAHAHHYQRITYTHSDGRQIPYLVVGSGGHGPIEPLGLLCSGDKGPSPAIPCDVRLLKGLTLPEGDRASLVAANDRDFGFLRLTVNAPKRLLRGEFFAVENPAGQSTPTVRRDDWFTLDLDEHRVR